MVGRTSQEGTVGSGKSLPFHGITAEGWGNLAIAGLIMFWILQVAFEIIQSTIFAHLGSDFASFWSAGYIANHAGYAAVYDLNLMRRVQAPLLPSVDSGRFVFQPNPTPYLPVFVLPFQLLALMPPLLAGAFWLLLNIIGTVWYLRYFGDRVAGRYPSARLALMLMVSAPAFLNLFTGQINLPLMICVGEYLLAALAGRDLRAGLWLGGLLLKPQCLVLVIPALLLERSGKTLLGFIGSSAAIVAASWIMGGTASLQLLGGLWLGYASGLPTNDPQLMMNWRMIALQLGAFTGSQVGWTVAIIGLVATAVFGIRMWLRRGNAGPTRLTIAVATLFAATSLVAWHSHVHMAMILIPPLLALHMTRRDLLGGFLEIWCFIPASLYFVRLIVASMLHVGAISSAMSTIVDLPAGIGMFAMNIVLVIWGARLLERGGAVGANQIA